MKNNNIQRSLLLRSIKNRLFFGVVATFCFLIFVPLILIIGAIVVKGAPIVSLAFLTHLPKPVGEVGGGIANAIMGSLGIVCFASIIGVPLGILGGVYLSENQKGWFLNFCDFV